MDSQLWIHQLVPSARMRSEGTAYPRTPQYLIRLLAYHGRGSTPCPQCDTDLSDGATTLIDHVL